MICLPSAGKSVCHAMVIDLPIAAQLLTTCHVTGLPDAVPALHMQLSSELAKQLARFSQNFFSSVADSGHNVQLDDVKSYAPSSTDWEGAKEAANRLGWQLQERMHDKVCSR